MGGGGLVVVVIVVEHDTECCHNLSIIPSFIPPTNPSSAPPFLPGFDEITTNSVPSNEERVVREEYGT